MRYKAVSFLLAILLFASFFPFKTTPPASCPFCSEEVLKKQSVHEDSLSYALYSHKPMREGHVLLIPKRHVERFEDLSEEEMLSLQNMIKKTDSAVRQMFGTKSYLLLQKNGKEVGQTVPHLHIHYLPQKEGSSPLSLLLSFLANPFRSSMDDDEMKAAVESLSSFFQGNSHARILL